MEEKLKKVRAALEFYGNVSDYKAPLTGGMGKLYYDCGAKATIALTTLPELETDNAALTEAQGKLKAVEDVLKHWYSNDFRHPYAEEIREAIESTGE